MVVEVPVDGAHGQSGPQGNLFGAGAEVVLRKEGDHGIEYGGAVAVSDGGASVGDGSVLGCIPVLLGIRIRLGDRHRYYAPGPNFGLRPCSSRRLRATTLTMVDWWVMTQN